MKKMQMTILGVTVLALLVGPAVVQDAGAGVRVKATIVTPTVRVHVGNTPAWYYLGQVKARHHVRVQHTITQQDRTIATRLARYTGVPSRDLLQLRRQGFQWIEIGRRLNLRPPVVRAAMNGLSWQHFLNEQRTRVRCTCAAHELVGAANCDVVAYKDRFALDE
jgi:hypothetical protein